MFNTKTIITFLLSIMAASPIFSQDTTRVTNNLATPKSYILSEIVVTGKVKFNKQTVVQFTGLEKGQSINVPGDDISNAIKKLWKLGYFNDVNMYVAKTMNDSIVLELEVNELPKLAEAKLKGVRKGKAEELVKETSLTAGKIVNDNLITTTKNYLENKYKKEGYYQAKVAINTVVDTTENTANMIVLIDKGEKVRISKIAVEGNQKLVDSKIRKALKNTKEINKFNPLRIFKPSKFIKDKYKEDLVNLVEKYKELGYRDARVIKDSVKYDAKTNKVAIDLKVEEGRKYYFGDIKFVGNSVYTNTFLQRILSINKGDVYNSKIFKERVDDDNPDAVNIKNEYQNNGYLFSNVNTVEVKTVNDTIDFEIRITEGPVAYLNNVSITGNTKTNDFVIYRQLRTRPGQKWSKDNVVRTIRELGQLGFFDPEAIKPDVKPNGADGTVDVGFNLTENGASQVELQGGYGGGGFIGTLGLNFNNFSLRNIFNKEAYKPLPMGDGQKMSLRLQGSTYFQTYSMTFSEPWFGGKKPIGFYTSLSHSKQFLYDFNSRDVTRNQSFNITTISVGISKMLRVPDDYFSVSHTLSFQYYDLNNYNTGLFTFGNGASRNMNYTFGITRNNKGINPIFPTQGSEFSISAKFTPPYSLFNKVDYANLGNLPEYKYKYQGTSYVDANGQLVTNGVYVDKLPGGNVAPNRVFDVNQAVADPAKVDQKKFNYLEYYKVKFKGELFTRVYKDLVFKTLGEFGFLGAYNQDRGLVPFERFYLGGDGMANFSMDGRETIQLRGYPNQSLTPINANGEQIGATVYNKFSLELRYPITLKQTASIYALTFLEAGSSYASFKNYNPFNLQRSAGFGLRIFMPAFGLLGIDFGHGFDAVPGAGVQQKSGWQTHFIIGQQF